MKYAKHVVKEYKDGKLVNDYELLEGPLCWYSHSYGKVETMTAVSFFVDSEPYDDLQEIHDSGEEWVVEQWECEVPDSPDTPDDLTEKEYLEWQREHEGEYAPDDAEWHLAETCSLSEYLASMDEDTE